MPWRIYKIRNKINGKVYIGQTRYDVDLRWQQHFKNKNPKSLIAGALQKYGAEGFIFSQIGLCCTVEDANLLEARFISAHNATHPQFGYNLKGMGEGIATKRFCKQGHDKEVVGSYRSACRECMRLRARAYKKTPEGRNAQRKASKKAYGQPGLAERHKKRREIYASDPRKTEKLRKTYNALRNDPIRWARELARQTARRRKRREKKMLESM